MESSSGAHRGYSVEGSKLSLRSSTQTVLASIIVRAKLSNNPVAPPRLRCSKKPAIGFDILSTWSRFVEWSVLNPSAPISVEINISMAMRSPATSSKTPKYNQLCAMAAQTMPYLRESSTLGLDALKRGLPLGAGSCPTRVPWGSHKTTWVYARSGRSPTSGFEERRRSEIEWFCLEDVPLVDDSRCWIRDVAEISRQ